MLIKIIIFNAFLFLIVLGAYPLSAAPLAGEWDVTIKVRNRTWYPDGTVVFDYDRAVRNNYVFYPNGQFLNSSVAGQYGTWRKSGSNFRIYPDFNGPPSVINGPNNSVEMTQYEIYGKKKGNTIKGKYISRFTIKVWDYFSGIVVVNFNESIGTFIGRQKTIYKQSKAKNYQEQSDPNALIESIIKAQLATQNK